MILASSFSQDYLLRQSQSEATSLYLQRTLKHLNRQLSTNGAEVRHSTLYVIVNLALVADMSGDHKAAAIHVSGLEKIVHLLGGMETFEGQTKLRVNLER